MLFRWNDNDQYGHINNANYHAIFDSVINIFLIKHCGLQTGLKRSTRVGFMVRFIESHLYVDEGGGVGVRRVGQRILRSSLNVIRDFGYLRTPLLPSIMPPCPGIPQRTPLRSPQWRYIICEQPP